MDVPVAKKGDRVVGLDRHIVLAAGVPTAETTPFSGPITEATAATVFIEDENVALVGSAAHNSVPHIPVSGPFVRPPTNRGVIHTGSETVFVEDIPVARAHDEVMCCNDPVDQTTGHVIATGTVITS
jgi:uncharacterized Zn-binding protein involved in type VI secretion